MNKTNFTVTELLDKLRHKNDQENIETLKQTISPPATTDKIKITSLDPQHRLQMSPMLEARFRFAGKWMNATLAFTWLSETDMENIWTDEQISEAISLRRENWPTSVLNHYTSDKLGLFAVDVDEGNEIYLVFDGGEEPQIVSYFGAQEKRYNDLKAYLLTYLDIQ